MKKFYKTNWLFKLKSTVMLSAMLFAGTAMAQLSGTYTVNPSGSGTSNYTSFSALATALTSVSGPVTVNVAAGTYTEKFKLNAITGASSTNTITINGGGATISSGSGAVVELNGADYVTIDNLKIVATSSSAAGSRGVWIHNQSDYNTISGCDISLSAYTGTSNSTAYVALSASATGNSSGNHGIGNTITGNTMHGGTNSVGPYYGIVDYRTSSSSEAQNTISDNTISDFYYYGAYMYYARGLQMTGNDISENRSGGSTVYGVYTYYGESSNMQFKFNKNDVHDLAGTTVYMGYFYYSDGTSTVRSEILDNTFTDNTASSNIYGFQASYCDYLSMEGNKHGYNSAGSYQYYGFAVNYSNNANVKNNDFYNNKAGTYQYYTYQVNYSNNVNLEGNKVRNSEAGSYFYYTFRIYYSNNVKHVANEFTGNKSSNYFYYTNYIYYSQNLTMTDCVFTGNTATNYWYYCHYMYQSPGMTIENNTISNNTAGTFYYTYYIYYSGNSLFKDNTISKNAATNGIYYTFYNYYGDNNVFDGNEFSKNTGLYIYYTWMLYYSTGLDLINNEYYGNEGDYYMYYVWYAYQCDEVVIAHNTVSMEFDPQYYVYPSYFYTNSGADFQFKNNIMAINSQAGYTTYLMYMPYYSDIEFANNVYYSNSGAPFYTNTTMTFAQWVTTTGETGAVYADPKFTDLANGDLTPTNPAISNIGEPGLAALDFYGDTRTACGPDPGAIEFFVDHSASNMSSLPTAACGGYSPQISIDFKNGTNVAMTNVPMFYSVNGTSKTEYIANAAASSTTNFTFATRPVFHTPGVNTVVVGLGCDDDPSNNTITKTITITAAPSGADLVKSSTWNGYFRTGNTGDPDVTVPDYEVVYDIQSPTKYTSAGYGSDWTVTNASMIVGGAAIGASEGITVNGSAGTLSVDPAASLQGETIYVALMINDINTGCDSMIGRYMYVPFTPVVDFEAKDVCLGDVAQFKNKSTLAGPDYMLNHWEFDDPDASITDDNSDIQDGFWNYSTFGTPNVTLTVVNGEYPLFEYSISKTVTVTPKPVVTYKVYNKCFGTPVEFNNTTAMPNGTTTGITYAWEFGDGQKSTAKSPNHNYSSPGQRVVKLVATANGCSETVSKNAYQFEMPTANFASKGACNFEEIEFTNSSTIPNGAKMGYAWDFGDSDIARDANPKHAFSTAGVKTIKLKTTSEFGCENTVTKTITLNESPEANFTWDKACNLTPINFTRTGSVPNGGANTSYTWNFDNEGTSGVENPQHLFSKVGAKKVTLTAADLNGCTSTITKEVPVVLQAVAAFEASSVCEGDEAVFTNKSTVAAGNLQYLWKFGDGTTSTDLSPRHAYATTGTTQIIGVTLEAIVPGGCSDQVTKSITVNAAPDASFTPNVQGRTVAFDGPSGNSIYQWRFGDGSKATTEDPIYTYSNVDQGTFEVCLATKNAECWSEECQTITINLAGVEELTENNDMITVYPNPNNGSFNLTIENAKADAVIKVGDMLGNEIPAMVVNNLNGKYSVDLSAVASGVYFVQVKNGDYYATKRITVSK